MSTDFWDRLRSTTPARIGIARYGAGVATGSVLDAQALHARARDAVHRPLDVPALVEDLRALDLGIPRVLASAAADRREYLGRPDLGRRPAGPLDRSTSPVDLAIVVADGLSAGAAQEHAPALLGALLPLLDGGTTIAPPVVATLGRVALGDHLGEALGARLVLMLLGERPGLSSTDSLGAYLTWAPRPGLPDARRNCVSNIRPPAGLSYESAARTLAALMVGARRLGGTGVHLKDRGDELLA
ncbi:ethanolamine ammonia-lyase subunit EutC [Nocardioides sp. cx-169]|uniref:ethanolamine ammonia-lyase subunit EutC n=1 Tax=Nocardioides sp. cx-169 TaxID=2899080 RepID=UPI001E58CBA2|nr:ethanolamine ammonia-lyase subunit EutC [Nocardioides sp. cx-169]MCD4534066.1 ethanolamine ammonia-lyase subunit EutC [Nocardioides sp. cx-169]